ncbi:zinc-ribbon domain-containing protein, partial [Mogibacterium timidum]
VFRSGADYDDVLSLLQQTAESVRFSRQNFKISSYADRIAEKLMDGVELAIMDVVDKSEVEACPVCGMEVQPGAMYCMDCGAEL